jgi:probable O-glycosylation ligase (exosortase A-associated)
MFVPGPPGVPTYQKDRVSGGWEQGNGSGVIDVGRCWDRRRADLGGPWLRPVWVARLARRHIDRNAVAEGLAKLRDLAFVGAWLVLLPVALKGAHLGVLLWAWTSLLAPNDVLYGLGASVPFAKVSAGLTLGLMLFGRGGGIRLRWNATVLLMTALALTGLASQTMGLSANTDAGWELYQKYAKILLLAVFVTAVMRDRLRLHGLLFTICLGIGFTAAAEGTKFLLSGSAHKVLGTPSTGDNNQVGLDVLLIMPILYYLCATARQRLLRLACVAVIALCAICVVATASRAAFIGLALLGVAFILGSRRKVAGLLFMAALVAAGSQLVDQGWVDRMNTIQTAETDDSFMGRVGAWKVSTAVALERPLVGGGFHAIQYYDVWSTHWATAAGFTVLPEAVPTLAPKAAHSIYFEVLGDLGFVGLMLFLALFWVAWRNAVAVRRLLRRSAREDLAWAASLAGALQMSVMVFLIGGASLSAAYYDIDYLLVAILASLRDLVERSLASSTPTPLTVAVPARGFTAQAPPVLAA